MRHWNYSVSYSDLSSRLWCFCTGEMLKHFCLHLGFGLLFGIVLLKKNHNWVAKSRGCIAHLGALLDGRSFRKEEKQYGEKENSAHLFSFRVTRTVPIFPSGHFRYCSNRIRWTKEDFFFSSHHNTNIIDFKAAHRTTVIWEMIF